MAFDNPTRNRLNTFVGQTRRLITDEFTQQFQSLYGIALTGELTPLSELKHLDEAGLATAAILRARIDYLISSQPVERDGAKVAVNRLAREQAFTVLNRLAAVRMAEKRDLIVESVGHGFQSKGFQVFDRVAGKALGDTFQRYRRFLFCLFDELSVDLGVLFDRRSPQALLFPREPALLALFELINAPDLDALWAEDETIGWIYQYYNDQAERKTMREQSSAPRNSRELAVRNQFFTPRYVVEFLTDNTLGRIWYEMTRGETKLKEQCRYLVRRPTEIFLKSGEASPSASANPKSEIENPKSQEELLRAPVHIPHRPLKDPRTILMLDPACGSMHFGLYAFDLFEVIYDEAWALEEKFGADALSRPPGMKSLHATYAGKDALLKDVPRLIIEHNLHGIDIDPRCAQIAGLSLWLRAQKAWQRLGLKPAERPAIKRSSIVCAEPMPGEKELLREFVEREFPAAERAVCLRLLEAIFDKMQLAGEAGSLLKIEEEIRSAIEDARDAWQKLATRPPELFTTTELNQLSTAPELTGLEQAVSSLATDPRHLTTDFWERIEERIYAALRDYAEQAENGGGFQRRLFAEDAARGFAFIDVCRKRYDVALMNPPFGDTTEVAGAYLAANFGKFSNNLLCSFLARGRWLCPGGAVGAISDSTWLKKADYEDFREFLLAASNGLRSLIDLGWGVLDGANVATCCFTSIASNSTDNRVTSIRAVELELDDKEPAVLATLIYLKGEGSPSRAPAFVRNLSFFEKFPGKAIAYETHDALVPLFLNWKPLEPEFATTRRGYTPGDTFRFFRCWWEVSIEKRGSTWWTLNNGGAFAPVVGDGLFVALHEPDWASYRPLTGFRLESEQWFGKAGLGWGKRTDFMYVYPLPAGSMFSNEGHSAFPTQARYTWPLIAYLNSDVGQTLLNLFCGQHKLAGYVAQLPSPDLDSPALKEAGKMAQSIWRSVAFLQTRVETAEHFVASVRLGETPTSIVKSYISTASWYEDNLRTIDAMIAATIAGVSLAGANQVGFAVRPKTSFSKERPESGWIDEIISFALGCSLGRWDIRYATGEQAAPELPDPFAPLPVCPPGQLQNAQGLPARPEDVPAAYPVRIPWDGILVDDPNHPLDLERRVREVIEIIWSGQEGGPTAEAIEHEACEILGVKSLRDYFRKPAGFFADHLKRYSKSRRQAPIYWPLSTASGGYTLWIYYHRLTDQTLHTCLANFIDPEIKRIKVTIELQRNQGKVSGQVGELQSFLNELLELHDEIERVIKLPWKPNLNDGVLITAAPLWKLFRLGKWQKDLKACWADLEAGDYDWAHLAYTIWPTRVREKCKNDRSLAIAHGLESLCEVKAPEKKAKKSKAKKSQMEMEESE